MPAREYFMADKISLCCSILGPDVGRVFSVKISRGEIVDALKDAIKEKKAPELDHIAADKFDIWKASEHAQPPATIGDISHTFAAPYSPFRRHHRR